MSLFRPSKRDLYQLQILVEKNLTETDIINFMDIDFGEFVKWKQKPEALEILSTRKVIDSSKDTIKHPDFADQVEVAFECGLVKYYRFTDQYKMPTGRYKYIMAAIREVDLRMDLSTMNGYVDDLKKSLDGQAKQIDLAKAWKTIFSIETRLSLAFEPAGIKKLASVCYFTEDEILTTWDKEEGKKKVEFWDKHNCLDFFLTKPISELIRLNDSSITSLETYLSQAAVILEELSYQAPQPSSENL